MTTDDPPEWAMRLARDIPLLYLAPGELIGIGRAIADAVDAAVHRARRACRERTRPMTTTDLPDWALRLAREALDAYVDDGTVARAISDAVDAARVEAARVAGGAANYSVYRDAILALRGKEPKRP